MWLLKSSGLLDWEEVSATVWAFWLSAEGLLEDVSLGHFLPQGTRLPLLLSSAVSARLVCSGWTTRWLLSSRCLIGKSPWRGGCHTWCSPHGGAVLRLIFTTLCSSSCLPLIEEERDRCLLTLLTSQSTKDRRHPSGQRMCAGTCSELHSPWGTLLSWC